MKMGSLRIRTEIADPVGPPRNGILYLRSEAEVAELRPNEAILNQVNLDPGGIAVTARKSLRSSPAILILLQGLINKSHQS